MSRKARSAATPGHTLGRTLRPVAVCTVLVASLLVLCGCSLTLGASTTTSASASTSQTSGSVTSATGATTAETGVSDADLLQDLDSPAEAVASAVYQSVVNVRVTGVVVSRFFGNQPYEGIGSGIIYTADGYILTNDHVVSQNGQPADTVEVTFATGETVSASIVATDATHDIAAIKVDKTGLMPVRLGRSSDIKLGEWAIAIGSPSDYRNSVTLGIVSGLERELATGDPSSPTLSGLVQTDAAISPGNSGGGLFDARGRLIGMPEAYLPPAQTGAENIGFAIPVDTLAEVAKKLTGR